MEPFEQKKASFDIISIIPALVAGVVAFLGWKFVERYARERERRADLRALSIAFGDTVDSVTADATKYYALNGDAPGAAALASAIKSKLALLPDQLGVIAQAGIKIDAREPMKHFRQAVTGGEFEVASRQASPVEAEIHAKIPAAGQHLNRYVQLLLYKELIQSKEG